MPEYKLMYFDVRGLGEVIRQIFAYANVPFEDVRFSHDSWTPEKKEELNLPWGQLPILEVDGKVFGQSVAISRYLARKFKLVGKDEFDELRCDEIVEAFRDFGNKWSPLFPLLMDPNSDQKKKEELLKNLVDVEAPKDLAKFDSLLKKSKDGWLVGDSLTWADIHVAHFISQLETVFAIKLTTNFTALEEFVTRVHNVPAIKEWIAKRPQTKF